MLTRIVGVAVAVVCKQMMVVVVVPNVVLVVMIRRWGEGRRRAASDLLLMLHVVVVDKNLMRRRSRGRWNRDVALLLRRLWRQGIHVCLLRRRLLIRCGKSLMMMVMMMEVVEVMHRKRHERRLAGCGWASTILFRGGRSWLLLLLHIEEVLLDLK
jgi:hypothetical protein